MKQARSWMLANLKIICQFHAHLVHQNSVDISWAEIYRRRLFLGSSDSADRGRSIIRVNFHAEKKIIVSMSEEI
jgi:hypothetical protein